jgi:hypothetical protein
MLHRRLGRGEASHLLLLVLLLLVLLLLVWSVEAGHTAAIKPRRAATCRQI